jgi:hypothetical protein
VHDRDVAGHQVRELCQEQRGAQIAHQAVVHERLGLRGLVGTGRYVEVDLRVALAAASRHDHVGARQQLGLCLQSCAVEREPGRIGPDALPRLHLALIALLRDLPVEFERDDAMHDVGRKRRRIGRRRRGIERLPVRVQPFTEAGNDPDPGDPDLAGFRHRPSPLSGRRSPPRTFPC